MKVKVLFISAICALSVYSCSTDRAEDEIVKPQGKKEIDLKPLKKENNQGGTAKGGDTIIMQPTKSNGPLDPTTPTDPNEGGDPKDVPLPPRR
ncbi:hypothetical protein MKJ01_05395 [Chryseobacterium sp. SSA4.19]|uniref:hypothetical protein n=1 Tax=Chryseobacterium sp. SSA4.19 TaxID=2919915 RepID=UPI001F4E6AB6|nr:hypothetical protein [Chryseobacterium sp. SSA4.19]MCJ8153195.1 hypothetical protein [Chryseobacterium sp. SSA4.19]